MKLSDVTAYAWSNLRRHRLRTALTACGVAVGVSTLTVLVSLGTGLERKVKHELNRTEFITRVNVMPGGLKAQLMRGVRSADAQQKFLNKDDIARIEKVPGVLAAFPALQVQLTCESPYGVSPAITVEGLPAKVLTAPYQDALLAGKYWTAEEAGPVAVLPSQLVDELGYESPEAALGTKVAFSRLDAYWRYEKKPVEGDPKRFTLERPEGLKVQELEVIGVYNSEAFGLMGQRVQVPLETARKLVKDYGFGELATGDTYPAVIAKVEQAEQVSQVIKQIEDEGYDTLSVFDYLKVLGIVFAVFQVMLGFFGGIGLLVAFFGIANTMIMAVLERTREIGVLKALGGRNRDVRRMVFFEAAMIGCLGGVVGVALGWMVGAGLDGIGSALLATQLGGKPLDVFYVPSWLAVGAVLVSTGVAAVAGIYPAWRAARLDPVVSLRHE